jgi:DNA-binding XRE family transcriptional regulator
MVDFQISMAAARVNANLTQEKAAEKLGVSKDTVIRWESGKTTPSTAIVMAMALVYNIPVEYISIPQKTT